MATVLGIILGSIIAWGLFFSDVPEKPMNPTRVCIDGVEYFKYLGLSPVFNRDGTVRICMENK